MSLRRGTHGVCAWRSTHLPCRSASSNSATTSARVMWLVRSCASHAHIRVPALYLHLGVCRCLNDASSICTDL
jgi:hypothetical protein